MLKSLSRLALLFVAVSVLYSCGDNNSNRVLVFSKTVGYRHSSIEPGKLAIQKLGTENGFVVDTTEDASLFTEENLKRYSAIIFLNTTGDILDHIQQADFERYIQAGGGFVGVHSAADTEYDWIWYGRLVGGYFNGHPEIQDASIIVLDKTHPSTKMLPDSWGRKDEWYNYKSLRSEINPLLNLDESSYSGGTNGANHPIAWYHDFDGGRAFYTGGGHTDESYSEPLFLEHLLGGIQYAIGENKRDYSKAHFHRVPEEDRFVKTVLVRNLNEPMELDVFADGSVILVERRGNIKLYDPVVGVLDSITKLPVYSKEEDGLLGVTIDPDYETNKWIYLMYSPVGDEPKQHVSRFVFDKDSLHYATEKVLLEIAVQREECCHSGGSLEFGPDGNLFITVGDNTNPFDSNGFAPIDERKDRASWDAQGSSSNTNDLRGKILRIKPLADGTYAIPEGNLFAEGTPKARPEIYIMGCRNPFRMGIDHKTGYLYWGDVGPDSGTDDELRGPMGYDEVNQAREAGYYGWPYFRGDGKQYLDYDFQTEVSGKAFDPEKPINESPNNTGLRELPPFQKSMIWYSYDRSKEFPWVGAGGKNPMAGPVYYEDHYEGSDKYPAFFDGRLFIYEWMRHWIYTVKFDEQGEMIKIDPFMQNETFSRPMDMVFGNDGRLYLLEYGELWFARNMDARLTRLDYVRGNRTPVAKITADKTRGAAPLTTIFSAENSYDFDDDKLKYEWDFGDGSPKNITAFPSHTFKEPGIYKVQLTVKDKNRQVSVATQEVEVGNAPPHIAWELAGNQSFYWDNREIDYQVKVTDAEDGSLESGSIKAKDVQVSIDYLPQGYDFTLATQGHQRAPVNAAPAGKRLIDASDCKSCHAFNKKVNGPSYLDIAIRYRGDDFAARNLSKKIIKGGAGNWGQTVMSAHPQVSEEDATEMALYIMSLSERKKVDSKYPVKGKYVQEEHISKKEKGTYILIASYTDNGKASIKPITGRSQLELRHPRVPAKNYDEASTLMRHSGKSVYDIYGGQYLMYAQIDLTDVTSILLNGTLREGREAGGTIEFRIDAPDGELIGKLEMTKPGEFDVPLMNKEGKHDLYLVFTKPKDQNRQVVFFNWMEFKVEEAESTALN